MQINRRALFVMAVVAAALCATVRGEPESASSSLSAIDPSHRYRCAVCRRTMSVLWDFGAQARLECRAKENLTVIDDQCELSRLKAEYLTASLDGFCDGLGYKHRLRVENNAPVIVEDEHAEDEEAERIVAVCSKWIHRDHHAEDMGLFFAMNINAKKDKERILPRLQHKFCMSACDMPKIPPRRKKMDQIHREHHHDWTGIEDKIRASESLAAQKAAERAASESKAEL